MIEILLSEEECNDPIYASIFGWAGVVIANFFFFSPLNLFIKLSKTGEKDHIPVFMLFFNVFNTALWVIYGLCGGGTQPWVANSIGLTLSSVYVIWYLLYCFNEGSKKAFAILGYLVMLGGVIFVALYGHYNDTIGHPIMVWVGWIALVINTIMYAAPGQNLVRMS